MADNNKKLINATQLDRFANALNRRHEEDFSSLVNITTQLNELKADKDALDSLSEKLYCDTFLPKKQFENADIEILLNEYPDEYLAPTIVYGNLNSPIDAVLDAVYKITLFSNGKKVGEVIARGNYDEEEDTICLKPEELLDGSFSEYEILFEGKFFIVIMDKLKMTVVNDEVTGEPVSMSVEKSDTVSCFSLTGTSIDDLSELSIHIAVLEPTQVTTEFLREHLFVTQEEKDLWDNKAEKSYYTVVHENKNLNITQQSMEQSEDDDTVFYEVTTVEENLESFVDNTYYEAKITFENGTIIDLLKSYSWEETNEDEIEVVSVLFSKDFNDENKDDMVYVVQGAFNEETYPEADKMLGIIIRTYKADLGNVLQIELTQVDRYELTTKFLDEHRFVTEEEKEKWNSILVDENINFNTVNKTVIGAINELELELFEAKADIIGLNTYKIEKGDLPCYDSRKIELVEYIYDGTGTPFEDCVKISNDVYTLEDIRKAMNFKIILTRISDKSTREFSYTFVDESAMTLSGIPNDNGVVYAAYINNDILFVFEDHEEYTAGVYVNHTDSYYTSYVSFEKTLSGEFKPLDESFMINKPGKIVKVPCGCEDENCNAYYLGEVFNAVDFNKAGIFGHAEGLDTWALGDMAHSEGYLTEANGDMSHAEGYSSEANGTKSHAEGCGCIANADSSHAEGCHTIASSICQHVEGRGNIEDANQKYLHIVGNGTASNRSNAHTLDWNGNAWFAGKATVSVQPTNNNDLTTKLYVDQSIAQANETQTSLITQNIQETYAEKTYVDDSVKNKLDNVYVDISSEVDKTEKHYINNVITSTTLAPNVDNYIVFNTSFNLVPYKTYYVYVDYKLAGSTTVISGRTHEAALVNKDKITYVGKGSCIAYDNCTYTDGKLVKNNGTSVLVLKGLSDERILEKISIAPSGYELLNDDFFLTHRFVTDADNFATQDYVDQSIAQSNEDLQNQINELFQNVSNGKTLIASAITDKGIEASGDETFSSLSDKINQIPVGPPGSNIIGYINENNDIYISLTELESGTYTLKLEDYNGVLDDFHDIGTVEVE